VVSLHDSLSLFHGTPRGVAARHSLMAARWIRTPYSAVNLTQVCRIEYRRTDVSRDEVCGFDLYMVDGTVITLYHGDAGFENVAGELSEQDIVLALVPATSE
jgi:hypothetical protein